MSKLLSIFVFALILGLVLVNQAGCLLVAAAAGTGATVAYVAGDVDAALDASPKAVVNATEKACKDLDLVVITKESTNLDGKIIARTARDVKMTVVIKGESDKLSRVSIRAGVFGDDPMQDRLLQKIRENLATASTTRPSNFAQTY